MSWLKQNVVVLIGGLLLLTIPSISQANDPKKITIFAAASLTPALTEIGKNYKENTGISLIFSFASSGALARQISSGAPADIFISANKKWADWLKETKGKLIQRDQGILKNRLALIMTKGHIPQPVNIMDLPKIIESHRIAIGDPNHVPAGIYANQSLQRLGLWGKLSNNFAPAQNIRAALYLVQSQAAPFGIVYQSDLNRNEHIELIEILPEESHDPIIYQSILLSSQRENSKSAKAFFDFLTSNVSKSAFKKFGFIPVD